MLAGIVALDNDAQVEAVGTFLAVHADAHGEMQIAQPLEQQRIHSAFRARERERFGPEV